MKNNSPVVIFGFDAGVHELLQSWSIDAHLPTVASIIQRGHAGKISGDESISPHGLWLSLFSGIPRAKHGYYYFRQLVPETYNVRPYSDAKTPPFWHSLNGKKVFIMDAPETSPIPGLNGYQVANWSVHNASDRPTSEPAEFLKSIGPQMQILEEFNSSEKDDYRIYKRLLERIKNKGSAVCNVLRDEQFDLIVIVFSESHIAGHQFWKYLRPGLADTGSEGRASLLQIYQEIDRQIGEMLSYIQQDANIFIVSPMGIMDQHPTGGLTQAFCFKLGYQQREKTSKQTLKPISIASKIVPEALRGLISRNLSQNFRQRLMSDVFGRNTNWESTTAFALPSNYTGLIRVNLKGREPRGIVKQGTEYTQLLDQLENDLRQLIDPISESPAVERVVRSTEVFQTDPPEVLPDLFIKWKPTNYFVDRVLHPRAELKQRKPKLFRSNNHSETGFFACAGPDITENFRQTEISLLDVAPALLSLLQESGSGKSKTS